MVKCSGANLSSIWLAKLIGKPACLWYKAEGTVELDLMFIGGADGKKQEGPSSSMPFKSSEGPNFSISIHLEVPT